MRRAACVGVWRVMCRVCACVACDVAVCPGYLVGRVLGRAERRRRAQVAEARAAREGETHEGQVQAREGGVRASGRHGLRQPAGRD